MRKHFCIAITIFTLALLVSCATSSKTKKIDDPIATETTKKEAADEALKEDNKDFWSEVLADAIVAPPVYRISYVERAD